MVMDPDYRSYWRSYRYLFGSYTLWAGGHMLIRSREREREALVRISDGRRPYPSPTNGQRDGICHCWQRLHLSKSMDNASNYNSLSWFNLFYFLFSLLSMLLAQYCLDGVEMLLLIRGRPYRLLPRSAPIPDTPSIEECLSFR